MILCVNANAAIDRTVIASPFRLNEMHRPSRVMAAPGGKGCNVARALKRLGEEPVVTGWVGGFAGQFIEDGLRREGIRPGFVRVDFESRLCLSIIDPEADTLTEIYERGEEISPEKVEALKRLFRETVREYEAVVLSGSLPPGVPTDFYAELIEVAREAGVPALLDTSGEPLTLGAAKQPLLIKPNRHEFAGMLGYEPGDLPTMVQAAADMSVRCQSMIVVSLGAEGAIAASHANQGEVLHASPPALPVRSAVGSGDCMLAGITYGLTHSMPFAETIAYSVAAGTANALTYGAGAFSQADFEAVLAGVRVRKAS